MSTIYLICAIFMFAEIIVYICHFRNTSDPMQLSFFIMITIYGFSFYAMSNAQSVETAMLANIMCYISSVFTNFTLTMIVAKLCNIKLHSAIKTGLFVISSILLIIIMTNDSHHLFYKSVSLEYHDGTSVLTKEYGALHVLFYIFVMIILAMQLSFTIIAALKKKSVPFSAAIALASLDALCLFVYLIPRLTKAPTEFIPLFYAVSGATIIYILHEIETFDMTSNLTQLSELDSLSGFIAFDSKKRYMSSTPFALKVFPEIGDIRVRTRVKLSDSVFYKKIVTRLTTWNGSDFQPELLNVNGYSVTFTIQHINHGKEKSGFLITLTDDTKNQEYISLINEYNQNLEKKVAEKTAKLVKVQDSVITGMASMVESRDNSTGGHINRTSAGVRVFAEHLMKTDNYGMHSDKFYADVTKAAPMHDLGKIAVDDQILRKPGRFTPEEYEEMKKHSAEGSRIVASVLKEVDDKDFVNVAINVAHYHHEKWDGSGYPEKLSGESIPFESRIMALADVFDALVSKRCYKESMSYDKAFSIIEESLGTHFDPVLGREFLNCRPQLEALYDVINK